ncbi:MAG: transposase, partial [Actinomycetota bacterium]|nr:transposase [Actinomycetota bacterium]
MAKATIHPNRGADQIRSLLAQPEIVGLVADLQATRWTGRRGYPVRTMVGMVLVKSLYVLPTWTRAVALVAEHDALQAAVGCAGDIPSIDACYRFTRKLRQHKGLLDACIAAVIVALKDELPGFGEHVAIDGSDLPAYANGQRYLSKRGKVPRLRFSDPDASWGHRSSISTRSGGGYYGYKVHCAVDVASGLPISWTTRTAKDAEVPVVPDLLDAIKANGFAVMTLVMDRGYDAIDLY